MAGNGFSPAPAIIICTVEELRFQVVCLSEILITLLNGSKRSQGQLSEMVFLQELPFCLKYIQTSNKKDKTC